MGASNQSTEPIHSDWEYRRKETVVAGDMEYDTDCLRVLFPEASSLESAEVNHINMDCPDCGAIGELAIELRTMSLWCPICDHRVKFDPEAHLAAGLYIGDNQPECVSAE